VLSTEIRPPPAHHQLTGDGETQPSSAGLRAGLVWRGARTRVPALSPIRSGVMHRDDRVAAVAPGLNVHTAASAV
jgi:hypothetical protein